MPRIVFCRDCQREMHREFARSQRPIPNPRLYEPCDEKIASRSAQVTNPFSEWRALRPIEPGAPFVWPEGK
jgi:hypothetical protein